MTADGLRFLLVIVLCSTGCARVRMAGRPIPDFERHSSEQHSDFGVVYEKGGNLADARRQYQWAVKKDATNHLAWSNLGNVAMKMGDAEEARAAWERALALVPGYGPAVINLVAHLSEVAPAEAEKVLEEHLPLMRQPYRGVAEALLLELAR